MRERRDDNFASPERARSLFTVRAAISSALSSDAPRSLTLYLMCLYCRSRFLLQACCGISTPFVGSGRDFPERALSNRYVSGGFWTLCSVAYSFVSVFTTSNPSP